MIVLLYSLSPFVNSLVLSKNCSLHLGVSLHFSNLWTKFSSSSYRRHVPFSTSLLLPLSFHIPNLKYANPIPSFGLHWSIHISLHHSCFTCVSVLRPQAHTLSRIMLWKIKYGTLYDLAPLTIWCYVWNGLSWGTNREQRNYVINILDG